MNSIKFVLLVCAALVVSVVAQSSTKRPAQPINAWCSKALDGKVEDDPDVAAAVSRARGKWLPTAQCSQVNVALFIKSPGQSGWRRGHVNGNSYTFPASVYKLPVMVAAINWCRQKRSNPRCLDRFMKPMMQVSSNEATGSIVDAITETTNIDRVTPEWQRKRFYVEDFFNNRGSLGAMRLLTKTYPANKPGSVDLTRAEEQLWKAQGRNAMSPNCAGAIMTEIAEGLLLPQDRAYMLQLMKQARTSDHTWIGEGLPTNTKALYTKIGNAMGMLNEIAYFILADNTQVVLSVFTDCYKNVAAPKKNGLDRLARELVVEISKLKK